MPISTEQVLLEYAKTMIKDLGKEDGRRCLLRNVPLWREHYGETVTARVVRGIRQLLKEGGK
jgi:hypothetical protein